MIFELCLSQPIVKESDRDTRDTCLFSEWCVVGGYDESMVVLILSSACNGPGLSACTA